MLTLASGLLSLGVGLCACHIPFSRAFRENHQLSADDLKNIQFYTSDTILLRRVHSAQSREASQGSLAVVAQVEVEEIEIDSGTPGVVVEVHGEYLAVSFTPFDRERVLWFSTVDSPIAGRYTLTHVTDYGQSGATGPSAVRYSPGYFIRYGGADYRLVEPEDWNAYLVFDDDVTLDRTLKRSNPEGWKLSASASPE